MCQDRDSKCHKGVGINEPSPSKLGGMGQARSGNIIQKEVGVPSKGSKQNEVEDCIHQSEAEGDSTQTFLKRLSSSCQPRRSALKNTSIRRRTKGESGKKHGR